MNWRYGDDGMGYFPPEDFIAGDGLTEAFEEGWGMGFEPLIKIRI